MWNKKGFTMVEMLLIVGLFGLVSVGAFWINQRRMEGRRVADQERELVVAMRGVHALLQNYSDTDPAVIASTITPLLSNQGVLHRMEIFPREAFIDNSIRHKWGGRIELAGRPPGTLGRSTYEIALRDIPQNACARLATSSRILNMSARVLVNGAVVKHPASGVNVSHAADLCNREKNLLAVQGSFESFAEKPKSTGSLAYSRDPEHKYNMISYTKGTKIAAGATPSCSGGSKWNSDYQFCSCPENTYWNGRTCLPFGTPGICRLGESWNLDTESCERLPLDPRDPSKPWGIPPSAYVNGIYVPRPFLVAFENGEVKEKEVMFAKPGLAAEINEDLTKLDRLNPKYEMFGIDEENPTECAILPKNPSDAYIRKMTPDGEMLFWNHTSIKSMHPSSDLPEDFPITLGTRVDGMEGKWGHPLQAKTFWDGKTCVVCAHGRLDGDRCVTH